MNNQEKSKCCGTEVGKCSQYYGDKWNYDGCTKCSKPFEPEPYDSIKARGIVTDIDNIPSDLRSNKESDWEMEIAHDYYMKGIKETRQQMIEDFETALKYNIEDELTIERIMTALQALKQTKHE